VVLLEADVVILRLDAERAQAVEILVLHVGGGGLQDHLELEVLVEPVRVLAVAAVRRPARRLDVCDAPGLRTQHAQEGLRVHRARADLDVPGLVDQAAALRPVALQLEDQMLQRRALHETPSRWNSASTRNERRSRSRWRAISSWWKASSGRSVR